MSRTTNFKGSPLALEGQELKIGDKCPEFTVTGQDMADISSKSLAGKPMVISLIPSIDTPVCSVETKRFNQEFKDLNSAATCLTVSMDLPFAQKRWCGNEGVESVVVASDYKHRSVSKSFGALIKDWGLLSRAVFVCDKNGTITFVDYVTEVSAEPDYNSVMNALRAVLAV